MKQKYSKIFVLLLAIVVFFVGAGITVVDLCCANCLENVLAMKNRNSACDITDASLTGHSCCSNTDPANDVSPCTNHHDGKCCEAERITVDIDHRQTKLQLADSMVWSFVHCYCCCFCHTSDISENIYLSEHRDVSPPIPPREYLSLIRILII